MAREPWTQEEMDFIEQHVGKMAIPTLAKRLAEECGNVRTPTAVHVKLKKMGITNIRRETGRMTANELATLIGTDIKVVIRWIRKGLLKSVRRAACFKTKNYLISVENFWEFAEKNKDQVNFYKIKPNIIIPEPEWVEAERKKDYYAVPKKHRTAWTPSEDRVLVTMKKEGYSLEDIAKRLNRSVPAVKGRKERLVTKGVIPNERINIRWREEEIEMLYRLEEKGYTDERIAYELGREVYHIRMKRQMLRDAGKYKGTKKKWAKGKVS